MRIYNINDDELTATLEYQEFISENPTSGNLRIRAYSANEAIPVKGVKVEVSLLMGDNRVIFYEGETDESGLIDRITLPAPKLGLDNMVKPTSTIYDVFVNYPKGNISSLYKVHMYEDICVVQDINIAPFLGNMESSYGS